MKKLFTVFIFFNILTIILVYLNPFLLSTITSYDSLSLTEIVIYATFLLDFMLIPFFVLCKLGYMCFNFVEKDDWLLKCYRK